MRNSDPYRENAENILAICLLIVTMQHIRESPSASHVVRKSAWNGLPFVSLWGNLINCQNMRMEDEQFSALLYMKV